MCRVVKLCLTDAVIFILWKHDYTHKKRNLAKYIL